jgi:copper chaperone CopZ
MNLRILFAALALCASLTTFGSAIAEEGTPKQKPAATETKPKAKKLPAVAKGSTRTALNVEMCCAEGCPVHIHGALDEMKGVTFVHTDFATKTVTVDYVEKEVKLQAIKDAILELGYPVDGVEPEVGHGEQEEG